MELASASVWSSRFLTNCEHPSRPYLPRRDRIPRGTFNRAFRGTGRSRRTDHHAAEGSALCQHCADGDGVRDRAHTLSPGTRWEEIARQDELCGVEVAAPLMDSAACRVCDGDPGGTALGLVRQSKRVLRDAMAGGLPHSSHPPTEDGCGQRAVQSSCDPCMTTACSNRWQLVDEGILDQAVVDRMYGEMLDLFFCRRQRAL